MTLFLLKPPFTLMLLEGTIGWTLMLNHRANNSKLSASPQAEDLFLGLYGQMFFWAMQLTSHQRDKAEDLVQEAFIQFTLSRGVGSVQKPEAYLYVMLKNLHLAHIRQAAYIEGRDFSVADYDSVEMGLYTTEDVRDRLEVQDQLRRVCHYICIRKESSKAASVLALRFVLGYYPSEIALVLQNTRQAVSSWQRIARAEARAYLDAPGSVAFMRAGVISGRSIKGKVGEIPLRSGGVLPAKEFIGELRSALFASSRGKCLQAKVLRAVYGEREAAAINCSVLAHLASCRRCLDLVNVTLGMPSLAERHPLDMVDHESKPRGKGPDGPEGDGSEQSGPGPGMARKALKRYAGGVRRAIEHTPNELRISVNGFVVGSQRLSGEWNELRLSFQREERIAFVEIYTEQRVRLMFINVDPPPEGRVEHQFQTELSDGRSISLHLNFSNPWPSLQVGYHDPTFAAEAYLAEQRTADEAGGGREDVFDSADARLVAPGASTPSAGFLGSARNRLKVTLEAAGSLLQLIKSRLFSKWNLIASGTALVIVAALLATQGVWPTVTASELLLRSADAEDLEQEKAYAAGKAIHRSLILEERELPAGKILSRQRIQSWQSDGNRRSARRLYDENNRVIAGIWSENGASTLYRAGQNPKSLQRDSASADRGAPNREIGSNGLPDASDIWQLDLSARTFAVLMRQIKSARVEEGPGAYVIKYGVDSAAGDRQLADPGAPGPRPLNATLVLDKRTFHPREQTLVLRVDGGLIEYRLTEDSTETPPLNQVLPNVFQPDAELLSQPSGTGRGQPAVQRTK
jgi:RNA polymerase sigma factor (sigma-70 family)